MCEYTSKYIIAWYSVCD